MRKFIINVNGKSYEVDVEEVKEGSAPVMTSSVAAPKSASVPAPQIAAAQPVSQVEQSPAADPKPVANVSSDAIKMKSPMPGNILDVKVNVGDTIKKNQVLLILEAMKMENEIMSPQDGKVVSIPVTRGTTVNSGDILIIIE